MLPQNILNRGLEQLKTDGLYSKKARAEHKREQRVLREQERARKLEARAEAMRKRTEKRLLKKAVQEQLTKVLEEALKQKTAHKKAHKKANKKTNITAAGIVAREARSSKAYPMLGRLPGDSKAHSGIILSEETSKKTVTNTNQTGVINPTPIIRSQQTHTNPPNG